MRRSMGSPVGRSPTRGAGPTSWVSRSASFSSGNDIGCRRRGRSLRPPCSAGKIFHLSHSQTTAKADRLLPCGPPVSIYPYGDAGIEPRDNARLIVDDAALAEAWWQRAKPLLPLRIGEWRAVGLNERFR